MAEEDPALNAQKKETTILTGTHLPGRTLQSSLIEIPFATCLNRNLKMSRPRDTARIRTVPIPETIFHGLIKSIQRSAPMPEMFGPNIHHGESRNPNASNQEPPEITTLETPSMEAKLLTTGPFLMQIPKNASRPTTAVVYSESDTTFPPLTMRDTFLLLLTGL